MFHVTYTHSNTYRCSCCRRTWESEQWVADADVALAEIPTSFPVEDEYSSCDKVVVIDGSTGREVARSEVSFPPAWDRSAPYSYTHWAVWVDEETFPGRGRYTVQILKGTSRRSDEETPEPAFVTDRTWSEICAKLAERRRQADIKKAEADLADARRRLSNLRIEERTE